MHLCVCGNNKQILAESSHQRRKERIERHKKLTLQQYDNNTKALFINNINDLKNTLKNKNSIIMKKYTSVSSSSSSSTASENSNQLEQDQTAQGQLQEEDEDELLVENETYTYEYLPNSSTSQTNTSIQTKTTSNESEDEYVTECFEQTYSILDIMNKCQNNKKDQERQRSSSEMSGLSSVGSSSSSSLSNNVTSSSSINIGSVSPNTTLTKSDDIYEQERMPISMRTLNTELYYPASTRLPYISHLTCMQNMTEKPIPSQGMLFYAVVRPTRKPGFIN